MSERIAGNSGGKGGTSGGKGGKGGTRGGTGGGKSEMAGGRVGGKTEDSLKEKARGFIEETIKKPIAHCVRSREKENDWTIIHAIVNGIVKHDFPEEVDLRIGNDWWEIGNQGYTGSCAAWAATDSLLRWHLVRAKKINETERLSVQFTWMAAKETDNFTTYPETFIENSGTPLKGALNVLKKYGAVLDKHLPFGGRIIDPQMDAETFYSIASLFSINSYYSIIKEYDVNLDHLRMWLASIGPIIAMTDTDWNFRNYNNGGKLDSYDLTTVVPDTGHAIAIVGYTKNHFIIRNSWGTDWGDNGYAYASNDYVAAAFCEGYGIWV
jgi:hypothetical protein